MAPLKAAEVEVEDALLDAEVVEVVQLSLEDMHILKVMIRISFSGSRWRRRKRGTQTILVGVEGELVGVMAEVVEKPVLGVMMEVIAAVKDGLGMGGTSPGNSKYCTGGNGGVAPSGVDSLTTSGKKRLSQGILGTSKQSIVLQLQSTL